MQDDIQPPKGTTVDEPMTTTPGGDEPLTTEATIAEPEATSVEMSAVPDQSFSDEELDALKVEQDDAQPPMPAETAMDALDDSTSSEAPTTHDMDSSTPSGLATADSNSFPTAEAMMAMPTPTQAPVMGAKKSKKKLIIGAVIAALVAIVLVGGGVAYALWYQNPEKVLGDALKNAITAKSLSTQGVLSYEGEEGSLTVKLGSKMATGQNTGLDAEVKLKLKSLGNSEITLPAQVVQAKTGDVYLKVSKVKEAVQPLLNSFLDSYASSLGSLGGTSLTPQQLDLIKQEYMKQIDPFIQSVDGQWIVFKADTVDQYTDSDSQCVTDTLGKLGTDKAYLADVTKAYANNTFIETKENLGTKDGSIGYVVAINEATAEKFSEALKTTSFGKALQKCTDDKGSKDTDSNDTDSNDTTSDTTIRAELWVDQWSHSITRFAITATPGKKADIKGTLKLDLTTDFGADVTVATPKDAKSFEDIMKELENVGGAGLASGLL